MPGYRVDIPSINMIYVFILLLQKNYRFCFFFLMLLLFSFKRSVGRSMGMGNAGAI